MLYRAACRPVASHANLILPCHAHRMIWLSVSDTSSRLMLFSAMFSARLTPTMTMPFHCFSIKRRWVGHGSISATGISTAKLKTMWPARRKGYSNEATMNYACKSIWQRMRKAIGGGSLQDVRRRGNRKP